MQTKLQFTKIFTRTPGITGALFTRAKTRKQPKCPSTDDWVEKLWSTYTTEYYSAMKKSEIMPFAATWMVIEIVTLSEARERSRNVI